jgi:UDP-glucose 4-epimerase
MNILILGGNGYIGSALYKNLQEYDVNSIDRCFFGKNLGYSIDKNISKITKEDLEKYNIVILLASHSSVGLCQYDKPGSIKNNIVNAIHITELLKDHQKFIYASSASVYGAQPDPCIETQMGYQTYNWYDITKQTLDVYMESLIRIGKPIIGLRFGTVCGPSPNTRKDLFINNMVHNAINNHNLWYNNGYAKRSVLTIKDLITAFNAIIHNNFVSGIYNLKSFDTTIYQAVEIVSSTFDVPIEHRPDTISYNFTLDQTLFCKTFDWQPCNVLQDVIMDLSKASDYSSWCDREKWSNKDGYEF